MNLSTVSIPLVAMLAIAGCGATTNLAAQNGTAKPMKSDAPRVVIVRQEGFSNCPAFAPDHELTVFDASSWRLHVKKAVVQPNKLKTWRPDLSTTTALRYAVGSKPTAGYGVKLDGEIAVRKGVLTIPVRLRKPKPGMISATVLTSPCFYLQVTGADYNGVAIVNAGDGSVLKKLAL